MARNSLSFKRCATSGIFLLLVLFAIFTISTIALLNPHSTKATLKKTDISLSIQSSISLSITNCDTTTSPNSSQLNINLTPTPTGTFKSSCQTVSINTNAPGYTLTTKAATLPLLLTILIQPT